LEIEARFGDCDRYSFKSVQGGFYGSVYLAEAIRKPSMESPTSWLSKLKRNQIFEAIQEAGLDPRDFDLEDGDVEVRIKRKWSKSCFIIGGSPTRYVGHSIVGDGPDWPFEAYSWQSVIQRISRWLGDVKRDLETPDLWAALQRQAELLGANFDDVTGNTPFTPGEQKEIAEGLREWAVDARRTYSLSEPQRRVLDAKLDYLVNAAGRLGRIDWRNAFVGVILGYVLTAALPPDSARDMLFRAIGAIGHFFGLPELPSG
jgi:hypothetical protein